jgi:leader peptidase (prepilin peptidase)/N-methyltransferase
MPEIVILLADSPIAFVSFAFVFSLIVGSFLNVVIHRLPIMMERSFQAEYQAYFNPEEEQAEQPTYNLVKPDSTCPNCNHLIRWWENIPVFSWIWLKAKCSNCKHPVSLRYPAVELMTALMSAWVAWHFGYGIQALMGIILCWLLITMTFIDLDKMLLPDELTLPLIWIGLLINTSSTFVAPVDAIIGACAGYLILWSIYWAFKLLTGKEGMGYGDFKLLAALGAWFGWQYLPIVILLSSVVGAIVGLFIMFYKNSGKSLAIPFGPYLAAAGFITMLYGDWIADQYLQYLLR